jgi:hypothetical protein
VLFGLTALDSLFAAQESVVIEKDGLRLPILRGEEELYVHLPSSVCDSMTGPKGTGDPRVRTE